MSRESGSRPSRSDGRESTPENRSRPPRATGLTRRSALSAVGTISLGATAGCLSRLPGVESNQVSVEPETPEELSDATSPGEFYYLLEENGIDVDELYHDQNDETLSLFYDSNAEDEFESNEEIGIIYQAFMLVIEHGSELEALYTEIVDPFDGQVKGWGVEREWVEKFLEDEITEEQLWQTIVQTKDYGDDEEEGSEQRPEDEELESRDEEEDSDTEDGDDEDDSTDETETDDQSGNESTE